MLYVGEGPRGSNGACCTLHRTPIFHSATHNQTRPLWCCFLSGWACARPRPLWVSPMTSPVRLGVSPAAAPTPTGVFNQRFEALFPRAGALGCTVCFAPRRLSGLSVHECGATGSASGRTACPVRPTLHQSRSRHGHVSPLCPSCPSPPLPPVWMNVYFLFAWCRTSLPFNFLSVLAVRGGAVCPPTPPSWFSSGSKATSLTSYFGRLIVSSNSACPRPNSCSSPSNLAVFVSAWHPHQPIAASYLGDSPYSALFLTPTSSPLQCPVHFASYVILWYSPSPHVYHP